MDLRSRLLGLDLMSLCNQKQFLRLNEVSWNGSSGQIRGVSFLNQYQIYIK
jgi:hypothetical protein